MFLPLSLFNLHLPYTQNSKAMNAECKINKAKGIKLPLIGRDRDVVGEERGVC